MTDPSVPSTDPTQWVCENCSAINTVNQFTAQQCDNCGVIVVQLPGRVHPAGDTPVTVHKKRHTY